MDGPGYQVLVRAPPERCWDALATAEGLDGWFTRGAEVDARPGGRIVFRWKDWGPDRFTGEDGGPVLAAERPRRFVFQWHPGGLREPVTVDIAFAPDPEGTVVTVRDRGYPDTPEGRAQQLDCAAGWGEALALLKVWVERGVRAA